MAASVFQRTDCRLCHSKNVELIVKLEPVPLAEKFAATLQDAKSVERFPIDLYMCLDCGHTQQLDVIDSHTLWGEYTYSSGQNKELVPHFNDVAKNLIRMYRPCAGSLIVDVGSNDGSLLCPFKAAGCRVLGIDPAQDIARQASEAGIPTLPQLLSRELAAQIREEHGPAAIVTAFNVFAHTDDLEEMADSIKQMLAPDGVFVFECQYLLDVIDKFLLGTLFHEHMSHHSLKPMVKFLANHGLEIIDVQRVSIQHGSIIGIAQHMNGPKAKSSSVAELLALEEARKLDNPEALRVFVHKLQSLKLEVSNLLSECRKSGASIAGFGAARSGPTFLAQLGLGSALDCIFDDHPMKVNKFSPSDGINILPISKLYERKPDYVFILAWIHSQRIIASHRRYLEEGGKFVTLFPGLQVIEAASAFEAKGECIALS